MAFSPASSIQHVCGESLFINDLCKEGSCLFGKVVYSSQARAKILNVALDKALSLEGVSAVLTYTDIPGKNQTGPVVEDEPCLAESEVGYIGQAVALIAADTRDIAQKAADLVIIDYDPLPPILEIQESMAAGNLITRERKLSRGDLTSGLSQADHVLEGQLTTGSQEHWYLETQTSLAVPGEAGEMTVYASSQHPAETQAIVASVLGIPRNKVVVEVRRMGGAFGGKETQANPVAAWAALLANKTRKPVCFHLDRVDDQIMTGKRHRTHSFYKVGFTKTGKIVAYDLQMNADAGYTADLSGAILDRAVFHADNAYYIPHIQVIGRMWKTNHPSNTAFRGFGGPQGIAVIEQVIDRVARYLHTDPIEIRKINLYGQNTNNVTHYGEIVEDNHLPELIDELILSSGYKQRREEILQFNKEHEFFKKGLALTPVKFGISFTTTFLNQAAALIHLYQDGTLLVNHGGTEMGQGLDTKILGIVTEEMGVSPEIVRIAPTSTSHVPNTSATAASSGSDLNGMAVIDALRKLKSRIATVIVTHLSKNYPDDPSLPGEIVFRDNQLTDSRHPERSLSFEKAVNIAYHEQVCLSATGFYRTPGIHFDTATGKGHPFHYFAFGAAVSEVLLDVLTGDVSLLRTDILHDTGNSLNVAVDIGQVEGGFMQGVGWCTSEIISWDETGRLLNDSPGTYKIPTIADIPLDFRVRLFDKYPNLKAVSGSKAVGEPPFMLAFSVWLAIKDAISAAGNHRQEPEFSLPASKETIIKSLNRLTEK